MKGDWKFFAPPPIESWKWILFPLTWIAFITCLTKVCVEVMLWNLPGQFLRGMQLLPRHLRPFSLGALSSQVRWLSTLTSPWIVTLIPLSPGFQSFSQGPKYRDEAVSGPLDQLFYPAECHRVTLVDATRSWKITSWVPAQSQATKLHDVLNDLLFQTTKLWDSLLHSNKQSEQMEWAERTLIENVN